MSPTYLAWKSEMVIMFSEDGDDGSCPSPSPICRALPPAAPSKKAGFEGFCRTWTGIEFGLPRRSTTAEASGLSAGFSWTHSSPTSTQLKISFSGYCPASDGSTTSVADPALHFLHTCVNHNSPHCVQ
jgi:hypothetical protein